jgi:hypothetical protein
MEPRNTHHSQLNFTTQVQAWGGTPVQQRGESMARASSRWAWPAQAPGGHGQSRASSRRAEQAPGEHRASFRKTQRRIEEGKHLLDAQEIPPWHGEAVPARPRRYQARGSRRRHVGISPNSPCARSRCGEGLATRDQARGRHGRDPELRRRRRQECPGGNRQDLTDRQERHRLIYRLVTISAADSGGARRSQARRRRGDAVARASARKRMRASKGGATGRAGQGHLVGFDQVGWRRQVGPARQVGQVWQEREGFNQIFLKKLE